MPFKTFTPGVLTSSDVNTFLMQQAVITCTSTTRPSSPVEGMTIYETNTDLYKVYDGSNWVDQGVSAATWSNFTPTLTEWTQGNGTYTAVKYMQLGGLVFYKGIWTFGSTSAVSATDSPIFSLPVSAGETLGLSIGEAIWRQASSTDNVRGEAIKASGNTMQMNFSVPDSVLFNNAVMRRGWFTGSAQPLPFTFTTGDQIRWNVRYEAA
jgi:hypothetical protein